VYNVSVSVKQAREQQTLTTTTITSNKKTTKNSAYKVDQQQQQQQQIVQRCSLEAQSVAKSDTVAAAAVASYSTQSTQLSV